MATEYGVVLASLMGAAAALTGGVLSQRYQYLLERRKEHFAQLRDQVLVPWGRAIGARRANLEGRDPYVVIDYVAKDYRSTPGVAFSAGDQVPWSESSGLAEASQRHWPGLWAEWRQLGGEHERLGQRTIAHLRAVEEAFPPLPPGKAWANYPDDPATAVKLAVVSAWASHAQVFERRTYPDWVVEQLTQFGFWRGDDSEAKRQYARQVAQVLAQDPRALQDLESAAADLSQRYDAFARKVEDAIHTESFRGTCAYCPRFLS
jgi:hypothetical protein